MKLNWYLKRHHHEYYSLVEPFRKDGKNQHNKLYYFGRLTDDEVKTINYALDILKKCNIEKPKLDDILFNDHRRFLDVTFLNFIWEQWGISKIFNQSDNKKVQTSEIAKILTIYRCLDPGSYLSAVEWYNKTALDRILDINAEQINKSRIFRELDCIEDKKKDIENYLYTTLKERDADSLRFVFYDLTDSYFEGKNCELATPGRTKSNGFQKKRVVLSLLVNSNGYPFAWDILEDYTADVNTIKNLSTQWKTQFKFGDNEIILVFDRGMVSDENLKHLELNKYIYITAMDKNQIPNLKNVNIERFEILNSENMVEQIKKMMFVKYDDQTYYQNLEIVNGRRYVLIFNPDMYVDENNSREKLIIRAKAYLEEESKALSNAEKSRNESTTKNRIDKELKTMKADKFIEYDLEYLEINNQGKEVNSFRIIPKETDATKEAIKQAKRTDGLWVIVTNNTGIEKERKKLTEEDLISAYRDKNQIEQAFKDVKSFIKIQPFNVWEPKHVRAHYTICVLSYLLNITVTNRLREANIDIRSSQKIYEILREGIIGKMSLKSTGEESLNLMQLQSQQKMILELFRCEGIIEKNYLKSIGVNY
ncbi:MAG: IS1634 family transposase [Candidatus Methanoperedenaceae archaeon]|nr:IS1634 family transposase [Candidatus Methanoperedenaceae archaeon]